ncbi:MAG: 23S rRNA (uracil(1939)-C(5))-methyltransferase RlmD [Saprospiraceae bacterium]|nr:23S rRNA (uracil(1939)-C(5))-methyltransferase RlmD [Saprospiraceae bacterium]
MNANTPKIKKGHVLEDILIEDIAFGGEGISKLNTEYGDYVLFVKNSLPGQTVTAKIIKKKKRFAKCKLIKVTKFSEDEIDVPYQSIPGAPFAKLPIKKQEYYKEHATLEMFKRISSVDNIRDLYEGYISSPFVWHYRNKMEYSFSTLISELGTGEESEGYALGFKRRGQWWAVENLESDSGLFDEQFENSLLQIRNFCEKTSLPPWNPAKSCGFFRFLVVRKSFSNDKLLFNLVTTSDNIDNFDRQAFVDLLQSILGNRLAGIIHTINDEIGDVQKQPSKQTRILYGKDKIVERVLGLDFEISMQSFFQTNPLCAEKLYSKVIEYVRNSMKNSEETDIVAMDLFCGTGTIAQLLAKDKNISKVIGVDIVAEAIKDAKLNSIRNSIEGIQFYAADVRKFLYEYPQYVGKINTIVLDPPRGGIVPKALQRIIALNSKSIVYVSCNPSTQARDTLTLKEAGYNIKRFCLVDQFPHTAHIESIALFEKTS